MLKIHRPNLNISIRDISSGWDFLSLETIFRNSLKDTEKPVLSQVTLPASSVAWNIQHYYRIIVFFIIITCSILRWRPRHLTMAWNSLMLRTPSLSRSNNCSVQWMVKSPRHQCQSVTHLKQALQLLKFIFQDAKLLLSKYVMFNSPKVRQITYKINPDNVFDPIIPSFGRSSLDMRLFILWSALVQGLSQDINVKPSHYLFVIFSSPVSVCVVWDFLPVRGREEGGHETACDTPVTS